jgi:hypothetical protein
VNAVVVPDNTRVAGTEFAGAELVKNSWLAANVKTAEVPVITMFVGVKGVSTKLPVPAAAVGLLKVMLITIVEAVVPVPQVCVPLIPLNPVVVTPEMVIEAPDVSPWAFVVVRVAKPAE